LLALPCVAVLQTRATNYVFVKLIRTIRSPQKTRWRL